MWKNTLAWLDLRTGYRSLLDRRVQRTASGGPSWIATTGTCILGMFLIQLATGLALLSSYSPSTASAWASVQYIEQTPAGHFLRGLHYYSAQCLLILLGLHLVRILFQAGYRHRRELAWASGVLLLPLLTIWAVTGNPLPGTQKGFAQIQVEGNILAGTPGIGPMAQRVLIGGDQVGNLTLTHLSALHVAILPLLVGLLLVFHFHQLRRNAGTESHTESGQPADASPYWPGQTVRNLIVFGIAFAIVAVLAFRYGAPLDMPADPGLHHIPRPEWYFRSLFELRSYFSTDQEIIATMIIPGALMTFLVFFPLFDWFCSAWVSRVARVGFVLAGLIIWGGLTGSSLWRDWKDTDFQASQRHEQQLAARARLLATRGIPPEGAAFLLQQDPKTRGPQLFAQYCASCHPHMNSQGEGVAAEKPSAANLAGFATRRWVADILTPEKFASDAYFGHTPFRDGSMVEDGVTDNLSAEQIQQVVAALSAEAALKSQVDLDARDAKKIAQGNTLIQDDSDGCAACHKVHNAGELGDAPDLTGYGSRAWLIAFISNPGHERFYRDTNDRMPIFAPDPKNDRANILTAAEIGLIADWLRGQWYEGPQNSTAP